MKLGVGTIRQSLKRNFISYQTFTTNYNERDETNFPIFIHPSATEKIPKGKFKNPTESTQENVYDFICERL